MAGVGQHFPGNAFPAAAGEPRNVAAFPVPPGHHPRSSPSPHQRPAPQRGHANAPRGALFLPTNAAGNRRPDGDWEDMTPPVDNIAVQGQLQDQRYVDMAYYNLNVAPRHPPQPGHIVQVAPYEYHDRGMNDYMRAPQDVAAQPQAIAPPGPGIDIFDYVAQQLPAGPAPAFLNEWPHQLPFPNEAATEVLRRLASRYLNQQDAHVYMFRIEPYPAGGLRVDITLELAYLF